jgi:hypothetical protein
MSYYCFDGDYGLNDFLVFDFTGNNLPAMAFFTDEMTAEIYHTSSASDAQNKGFVLANGATNKLGDPVAAWHKSGGVNDRLTLGGPNKMSGLGKMQRDAFVEICLETAPF